MAISFEHDHDHAEYGGGIVPIQASMRAAKPDGTPGGKDKGGNDGGDGGDPAVLTGTYTSGLEDTADTDYFNITLNFYGDWTLDEQNALAAAADYLSLLITAGLADDTYEGALIDDLVIDVSKISIDGQLGIAAQGGPAAVRSSDDATPDGLTAVGIIQFDEADISRFLDAGTLDDVALHEMLHVMGIGTLWEVPGVRDWVDQETKENLATKNPNDVILTNTYVGAPPEYPDSIALDPGTNGAGHLNEDVYGDALMTSVVSLDSNYLSTETVGMLEDLGYSVDATVAAQLASTIDLNADYGADTFALAMV